MSDPSFVTGSFSYYTADRDPTNNEPLLNPGYFDPIQILYWKNTISGNLFLLINATTDNPAVLTWAKIAYTLSETI